MLELQMRDFCFRGFVNILQFEGSYLLLLYRDATVEGGVNARVLRHFAADGTSLPVPEVRPPYFNLQKGNLWLPEVYDEEHTGVCICSVTEFEDGGLEYRVRRRDSSSEAVTENVCSVRSEWVRAFRAALDGQVVLFQLDAIPFDVGDYCRCNP